MSTRTAMVTAATCGPGGRVVRGGGACDAPAPAGARRRVTAAQARRNRRFAALALLAVLTMAVTALAVGRSGSDPAPAPVAVPATATYVTVAPGETLWDVARTHAPDGTDPRAYIDSLRRVNALPSSAVPAWTVLRLPE